MDSLKDPPFKLAMQHEVFPECVAVLKGKGVLASVQLKVEAIGASCSHAGCARLAVDLRVFRIHVAACSHRGPLCTMATHSLGETGAEMHHLQVCN